MNDGNPTVVVEDESLAGSELLVFVGTVIAVLILISLCCKCCRMRPRRDDPIHIVVQCQCNCPGQRDEQNCRNCNRIKSRGDRPGRTQDQGHEENRPEERQDRGRNQREDAPGERLNQFQPPETQLQRRVAQLEDDLQISRGFRADAERQLEISRQTNATLERKLKEQRHPKTSLSIGTQTPPTEQQSELVAESNNAIKTTDATREGSRTPDAKLQAAWKDARAEVERQGKRIKDLQNERDAAQEEAKILKVEVSKLQGNQKKAVTSATAQTGHDRLQDEAMNELRQAKRKLEKDLQDARSTIKQEKQTSTALVEEKAALKSEKDRAVNERDDAYKQRDNAYKERDDASFKLKELQDRISRQTDEQDNKGKKSEEALKTLRSQLDIRLKENSMLKAELEQAKQENNSLRSKTQKQQKDLQEANSLRIKTQQQEKDLQKATESVKNHSKQLEEATSARMQAQNQAKALEARVTQLQTQLNQAEQKVGSLESNNKQLQDDLQKTTNDQNNAQSQAQDLKRRVDKLEADLKYSSQENNKLKAEKTQLEQDQQRNKPGVIELETKLQKVAEENDRLGAENRALQQKQQTVIEDCKNEITEVNKTISEYAKITNSLERERDAAKKDLLSYQERFKSARDECSALKTELAKAKKELAEAKEEFEKAKKELTEAKVDKLKATNLSQVLDTLKKQLNSVIQQTTAYDKPIGLEYKQNAAPSEQLATLQQHFAYIYEARKKAIVGGQRDTANMAPANMAPANMAPAKAPGLTRVPDTPMTDTEMTDTPMTNKKTKVASSPKTLPGRRQSPAPAVPAPSTKTPPPPQQFPPIGLSGDGKNLGFNFSGVPSLHFPKPEDLSKGPPPGPSNTNTHNPFAPEKDKPAGFKFGLGNQSSAEDSSKGTPPGPSNTNTHNPFAPEKDKPAGFKFGLGNQSSAEEPKPFKLHPGSGSTGAKPSTPNIKPAFSIPGLVFPGNSWSPDGKPTNNADGVTTTGNTGTTTTGNTGTTTTGNTGTTATGNTGTTTTTGNDITMTESDNVDTGGDGAKDDDHLSDTSSLLYDDSDPRVG